MLPGDIASARVAAGSPGRQPQEIERLIREHDAAEDTPTLCHHGRECPPGGRI
jgi:hypothetical protein